MVLLFCEYLNKFIFHSLTSPEYAATVLFVDCHSACAVLPLAGLHKVGLSGIQDNGNSHFSQKLFPWILYINAIKKVNINRKKFLSQKKLLFEVSSKEQISFTGKSFCRRIKCLSQKSFFSSQITKFTQTKKICQKKVSFTKKGFHHRHKFLSHKKFLSQKQVSVPETSFGNRDKFPSNTQNYVTLKREDNNCWPAKSFSLMGTFYYTFSLCSLIFSSFQCCCMNRVQKRG